MIFLTNEHIQHVLDMPTCLRAMEEAYRDLNEQRAGYRPRIDFYVPQEPYYYRWGTMEGASRKLGVFAIRMKSDMLVWEKQGDLETEDKYCIRPGTYCGLIFLLSVRNAEPLALMNDGYLQHMRVGACAGLGAKYLARKNSKVLGMIGSGGMARTYAMAIHEVRPIERIRVFSPTRANREKYASEMKDKLKIKVEAVDSAQRAVRGADIVALTTDSLIPVIKADWLELGMHVTNVRNNEAGPDVPKRADVIARLGDSTMLLDHPPANTIGGSDGMFAYFAGTDEEKQKVPRAPLREIDDPRIGTIPDLGEIDALMMPHPPRHALQGSKKIRRLFADPKAEELKYFRKNGFYPIMHIVAFKNEVLEKNAWAALSVMQAFKRAKEACNHYYDDPNWSRLAWARHLVEEERSVLGEDPWPYVVSRNRANLERFMSYSLDQGLMAKKMSVEELVHKSTRDT